MLLGVVLLAGSSCAAVEQTRRDALVADALWTCRCTAVGIAAGRSTPDGPEELWVAAGRDVFRVAPNGRSEVVWKAPLFTEILRLEAIDLDGDGVHEWVVLLDAGNVRGEVVAIEDGVRRRRGKPWGGWLRAWWEPDGTPMLLGQRVGGDRPFWGTVSRLERDDRDRLQPVDGGPVFPPRVGIFDAFTVPGAEGRMFGMRPDGRLVEYGPTTGLASPEQWVSDGRPIGRAVELRRTFRSILGEEEEAVIRLPPPVVGLPSGGALLVAGTAPAVAVFEDFILHRGGDVRSVRVDPDRGLSWGSRTAVVGRAITAASPWTPNGRTVWAAAVWTRAPQEFGPPETRILLFDPSTGDSLPVEALMGEPLRPPWPEAIGPRPGRRPDRPSEVP
jgi:hypothetical protein